MPSSCPSPTQPKKRLSSWKGMDVFYLEHFGIKVNDEGVWVPYYKRDNTLFRAKLFKHDGRSYWLGGQGKGQIPYGLEQLRKPTKVLVLTEGESDTLALRIAWPDTITAIGVPGASSWKPEWAVIAEGFERVYLSFDGDDAGEKLSEAVKVDLPDAKRLYLPRGSDTRAVLQQLGKRAYKALIEAAEARTIFNRTIRAEGKVHELYEKRAAA